MKEKFHFTLKRADVGKGGSIEVDNSNKIDKNYIMHLQL